MHDKAYTRRVESVFQLRGGPRNYCLSVEKEPKYDPWIEKLLVKMESD